MVDQKRCFMISPIGKEGSAIRSYADQVKKFLQYEVLGPLGYSTQRSDDINRVGKITDDIILEIADSELAVALLDFDNPNVYYELALRHASTKICIMIVSAEHVEENGLPFDIHVDRVFEFSRKSMESYRSNAITPRDLDEFKNKLISLIQDYEENKYVVSNPVTSAARKIVLPERMTVDDAKGYIQESINSINTTLDRRLDTLQVGISERFNSLSTLMENWMPEDLKSAVRDMYQNGSATYISGEEEAFRKLTEMTKTAKHSLRTTRFAPQAISMSHNDFYKAVCEFGKRENVICKRIMCINDTAKKQDILKMVFDTAGGSMQLYLTDRDNNFELVVIDETCAFLHFYDENRFIRSTLYIRGQAVVQEFAQIYDRLIDPVGQKIRCIECSDYVPGDMFSMTNDVQRVLSEFSV